MRHVANRGPSAERICGAEGGAATEAATARTLMTRARIERVYSSGLSDDVEPGARRSAEFTVLRLLLRAAEELRDFQRERLQADGVLDVGHRRDRQASIRNEVQRHRAADQ